MTEEKLYTIDELMEGKAPGSVRITSRGDHAYYGGWFQPFFKDERGLWVGLEENGRADTRYNGLMHYWKLYTEPKKKKVLRPAIIRINATGAYSLSYMLFESADVARRTLDDTFIRMAPASYAVEVEE